MMMILISSRSLEKKVPVASSKLKKNIFDIFFPYNVGNSSNVRMYLK